MIWHIGNRIWILKQDLDFEAVSLQIGFWIRFCSKIIRTDLHFKNLNPSVSCSLLAKQKQLEEIPRFFKPMTVLALNKIDSSHQHHAAVA